MPVNKVKFWTILIIINCLLFLPKYLLETATSSFFPFQGLFHGSVYDQFKLIFVRFNYDIFRVSIDLAVIVLIFYIFSTRFNLKKYSWFAGIYYILILLFLIYYNVLEKIYLVKPDLYDDLYLLKLGFMNLAGKFSLLIVLEILGFITIVWFVVKLFQYLFSLLLTLQFGKKTKIILYSLGFLLLINTLKSGITFEPHHIFQFTFAMIADDVIYSTEAYNNLHQFDLKKINKELHYDQYTLKTKPNVYFLFIESYGKILFDNPYLRTHHLALMQDCQHKLDEQGFHAYSIFSTSPISGGGSWISFSTVMFGFNLKNQATFLSLMKNAETTNFNHSFNWFRKEGYRNYRLISIPDNENMRLPWETFSRFYGTDEWIKYKDLHYHGLHYGFGPSPPDQYSVSYANEYIRKKGISPYTLFFITQNSHNPFYAPDSVVSDWRSLNTSVNVPLPNSVFFRKPKIEDYSKAINYDITALVQLILREGKENDIFILIGDHQPPVLTGSQDGFETPVHIIVRNSNFGNGFTKYGFTKGMIPQNSKIIRYEGIYSMFIHEFIRTYGNDTTHLPDYKPRGLQPNSK